MYFISNNLLREIMGATAKAVESKLSSESLYSPTDTCWTLSVWNIML